MLSPNKEYLGDERRTIDQSTTQKAPELEVRYDQSIYQPPRKAPELTFKISVADPGCLSQIPDPTFFYPGSEFFSSRVPDPHQRI
jgi:hypothetical protein